MASSNRHWPSMFKSKPNCNPHHQWHHDNVNSSSLISSTVPSPCHRSPYTSGAGCDERSPEPKPRWNPKPEQIRILEAIFNSGMVNPPRDEIRKIRAQLQEYGQVGDANVFYWFQNRKSRSKHKLRHLHNSSKNPDPNPNPDPQQALQNHASSVPQVTKRAPSSSSSFSEKSSPKDQIIPASKGFPIAGFSNVTDAVPNSPTASVNQSYNYFQTHNEPYFFPVQQNGQGVLLADNAMTTQGFCLSHELSNVAQDQQNVGPCTNLLLNEILCHGNSSKKDQDQEKTIKIMHQHQYPQHSFGFTPTSTCLPTNVVPSIMTTTVTVPSPTSITDQIQGAAAAKFTVFINDVAFEIAVGPFNVREAFGDDAVLVHASGHSVLTDQWGITLQPLQHGASYYLI